MPSRVSGSTRPAASPRSSHRSPSGGGAARSSSLSDGIGHEYGSALAIECGSAAAIQARVYARSRSTRAPRSPGAQTPTARWSVRGNDQR